MHYCTRMSWYSASGLVMHTPNKSMNITRVRSQVKVSLLYCIINQKQNDKNKSSETCEEENWRKQMTYRAHFLRELHPAPPARGPSAGRGCPRYSRPCEGRWVKHPPLNIPQAAEEKTPHQHHQTTYRITATHYKVIFYQKKKSKLFLNIKILIWIYKNAI